MPTAANAPLVQFLPATAEFTALPGTPAPDAPKLSAEARRTLRLKEQLPRGVTLGQRTDGRDKPFFLRVGPNDKRVTESFATERERNDKAEKLMHGVAAEGEAILSIPAAELRELHEFKRDLGMTLAEAKAILMQTQGGLKLKLTVAEAIERYHELRKSEGLTPDSVDHMTTHLKRFAATLGHLPLFLVTADRIRLWLHGTTEKGAKVGGIVGRGGMRVSPLTLRHHLKTVNVFFQRALLEKWCLENPCAAVQHPKVIEKDTTVATAKEIFHLLKINRDHRVIGRMALELFGGLRCSSVERVEPHHVSLEKRGLEMPGRKHKSGKRKYRQGHPDVLWAWVKHAGAAMFTEITEKNYDEQKRDAFIRAQVAAPHNVLRHSFASYLAAFTKDMPRVSYLMQHTSLKMTERYEGVATEQDAKLVFAMTPDAVLLSWDEFVSKTRVL